MDTEEEPNSEPTDGAPTVPDEDFVRPVRRTYRHIVCDKVTSMGELAAETFARDPQCQASTYCHFCQADFPVADFVWEGTDEAVGS
jgi:hypothetical protein